MAQFALGENTSRYMDRSKQLALALVGLLVASLVIASTHRLRNDGACQFSATASTAAPGHKDVFVMKGHTQFEGLPRKRYQRLLDELNGTVIFMWDDTREPSPVPGAPRLVSSTFNGDNTFVLVNEDECHAASPLHSNSYFQMQTAIALMHPFLNNTDYDQLYFIEPDVLCNGHWRSCLGPVRSREDDYFAWLVRTNANPCCELVGIGGGKFSGWDHMAGELPNLVPLERRWVSFLPIARFSRRFLADLYLNLNASSGHCEIYIATLASYLNRTLDNWPARMVGNIGIQAVDIDRLLVGGNDSLLYHPVKVPIRRDVNGSTVEL